MTRRWIAALAGLFMLMSPAPLLAGDPPPAGGLPRIVFAGGCFWCMQEPFERIEGVTSVAAGYAGGSTLNPTYDQVTTETTGHAEVVEVVYDPAKVSFDKLLYVFWRNIDPLDKGGQFCDRGNSYRTAIFYTTDEQKLSAEKSKADLDASKRFPHPIATEITKLNVFTKAEAYHQDYHKKNPNHYSFYRYGCGRDARLDALWGKEARGGVSAHF